MKKTAKGDIALCFPGEENWELWSADSKGRLAHTKGGKSQTAESPREFKDVSHFALPVTWTNCSPFWAATDNPAMLESIVGMRLETSGQKIEVSNGKHFDFDTVDREDGKTLVLPVSLVDIKGTLDLPKGDAEVFDVAPNLLAMPRNHLVLYRELGRWAACMTRNGRPVYFQALSAHEIDAGAVLELKCLLLQLHSQGVIKDLSGIVVWQPRLGESQRKLLEEELEMHVALEERPKPLLPEHPLDIVPRQVSLNREAEARSRKLKNWIAAAAMLFLAATAWFIWQDFSRRGAIANLQAEIAENQSRYGWIQPAGERWRSQQDAYDLNRFPIELIYRAVEDLPETGVRLTEFDYTRDRVMIRGEGSQTALVRNYTNQIKGRKDLQDYDWTFPPPKEDPKTNLASFEGTGKYRYGSSEAQ